MFGWMEIGFLIVQQELIVVVMDIGRYHIEVVSINLVNGEIIVEVFIGLLGDGDSSKIFYSSSVILSELLTDDEFTNKNFILARGLTTPF